MLSSQTTKTMAVEERNVHCLGSSSSEGREVDEFSGTQEGSLTSHTVILTRMQPIEHP